jgi:hypothetical protein
MLHLFGYTRIMDYTYDARTINVKSPNNTSKWQMGFNSAFKGLRISGAILPLPLTHFCLAQEQPYILPLIKNYS